MEILDIYHARGAIVTTPTKTTLSRITELAITGIASAAAAVGAVYGIGVARGTALEHQAAEIRRIDQQLSIHDADIRELKTFLRDFERQQNEQHRTIAEVLGEIRGDVKALRKQ